MSANINQKTPDATTPPATTPAVPKRMTNAQTVCNERNEKNKLCNGHLKQLKTAGEKSQVHLRGDDVLYKCHLCGTLYMGPPLGHVRDPEKQKRFVEARACIGQFQILAVIIDVTEIRQGEDRFTAITFTAGDGGRRLRYHERRRRPPASSSRVTTTTSMSGGTTYTSAHR